MFAIPPVMFLFGLILILIHHFSSQLPIWLGQFGLFLFYVAKFFMPWQCWALMIIAYLLTGIFIFHVVMKTSIYSVYGKIEPKWHTWVLWATTWPYAVIRLRLF